MFFFCLVPLQGCQRPLFNVVVLGGRAEEIGELCGETLRAHKEK